MENLNKKLTDELKMLFEFVPPERLKKQITYLLTQYFINKPVCELPHDTPLLAEDIEFLLNYLNISSELLET